MPSVTSTFRGFEGAVAPLRKLIMSYNFYFNSFFLFFFLLLFISFIIPFFLSFELGKEEELSEEKDFKSQLFFLFFSNGSAEKKQVEAA